MARYKLSNNIKITGFEEYDATKIPQQYRQGYSILKNKNRDKEYIINDAIKYYIEKFHSPKSEIEVIEIIKSELGTINREIDEASNSFFNFLCDKDILVSEDEMERTLTGEASYKTGEQIEDLTIIKLIADSQYLDVYLALNDVTGIKYIIKLLNRSKTINEDVFQDELYDLEREYVMLQSVNHIPYTCHAYALKQDQYQNSYIVLEYYDGKSLSAYLRDKATIGEEECLEMIDRILTIFSCFHNNKIIHGDIHSSNILVGEDRTVKVIDFGLSHSTASENNEVLIFGGVNFYMPPERINITSLKKYARPPDLYSDVYQLGLIMYKILYNDLPFDGFIWEELAQNIQRGEVNYPLFSFSNFSVPDELIAVIKKCLSLQPEARYKDASQLLADYRKDVFQAYEKVVN